MMIILMSLTGVSDLSREKRETVFATGSKLIWQPVMTGGFGYPANQLLRGLAVFDDHFYAITFNLMGGEVYRSLASEPLTWERTVDRGFVGFGNPFTPDFRSIKVWRNRLYIGSFFRDPHGAQVWGSSDGTLWNRVFDSAVVDDERGRNAGVRALEMFGDYLYAGTGTEFLGSARIYRTRTGQEWQSVVTDGFGRARGNGSIYCFGTFNQQLYAGTFNLRGAEVYRSSDGATWTPVATRGFGQSLNIYVYELRTYQPTPESASRLIAITGPNPSGGEVWAYDGERWSLFAPPGFGSRRNTDLWQANQFDEDFYVGTFKETFRPESQRSTDQGAELWRYDFASSQWMPETLNGFGNPDNQGIRVILPWQDALYVGTYNPKTGCELWKGTPR
jgi:hypothetical protein